MKNTRAFLSFLRGSTLLHTTFAAASIVICMAPSSLVAGTIVWDGNLVSATDIGIATNWAGDVLPSPAVPDTAQWNGTATGPLSLVYSNALLAGASPNAGINFDITAGQTESLNIDTGTNTGSLRLNAITIAAGAGAFSLGNGANSFTLTMGGAGGQTHTWTNNSTNGATIASDVILNRGGAGIHTLALAGTGNWTLNNPITGVDAINNWIISKSGTGTATIAGTNTYQGATSVTAGTLNYTGSVGLTGTAAAAFSVGASGGGNAVLNLPTGSSIKLNNTNINVGLGITNTTGQGFVNQSGGTVSGMNQLQLGAGASGSSYGYYKMSGGTLGLAELDLGGFNGASTGVMDVTAGTVNVSAWIVPARGVSGVGILNMTGGTLNFTGPAAQIQANWGAGAGSVTAINVANSNFIAAPANVNLMQTGTAGKLAAINLLGGGLMQVNSIAPGFAAGTSLLNFNGGTLKANAATTTFTTANLTGAFVYGAGGTIDNNGVAITVPSALQAPGGSGVSSVAVSAGGSGYLGAPAVTFTGGGGTGASGYAVLTGDSVSGIVITNPGTGYTSAPTAVLTGGGGTGATIGTVSTAANASGGMIFAGTGVTTLSGVSTYTGVTSVSSGKVSVTGSLAAASAVSVASGATLSGTGTVAGTATIASGGIVEGGAASTGKLTLGGLTFSGTANANVGTLSNYSATSAFGVGALNPSGAAGAVVINIASLGSATAGNTYRLFDYSTLGGTGASGFTLAPLPSRGVGNLSFATPGQINLTLTGLDFLKWTGTNGTAWDTSALNWKLNSTNAVTAYINSPGDSVVFDDSTSNNTVDISIADVAPTSLIVNNTLQDYRIEGTKGIVGLTSLTKNGGAILTLATANAYSGGTTLNAGTLNIDNVTAIGTGTFNINGGTIDNTSGGVTLSANNVQNWNADFTFGGTTPLNLGTGAVTMSASRIITTDGIAPLTVGGVISGTGFSLTKNGNGTLILGAVTPPNSYTGGTTLNSGTLQLNQTTGANAGTLNLAGGNLVMNPPANNFNYGAVINLTAAANISNIAAFQINHSGTINGGGHAVNVSTNTSRIYINGATTNGVSQFNVTGGAMGYDLNTGNNQGGGAPTVVSSGASLWFAGAGVPLANSITLNGGAGQGGTGALFQEGNAAPIISGSISLASGDSSIGGNNAAGVVSVTGKITGTGAMTKIGVNKYTLSGANEYTGSTTVNAGTLAAGVGTVAGVSSAFGKNSAVVMGNVAGAILDITGFNTQIGSITGGGATGGNVTLGAATLTTGADNTSPAAYGGVISGTGSLVKTGTGTETLTGASSFTGDLSINNGTLIANRVNNSTNPVTSAVGNNQSIRNITLSGGGTLQLNSGDTLGSAISTFATKIIIGPGSTVTNGGGVFNRLGSVTLNGGTLTSVSGAVAGYQTYSLDANSVITAGGSAASTISTNGTFPGIHLHANSVFDVADATGDSATDLTVSAPLINRNDSEGGAVIAAGLTKSGVGTMALTGVSTYTGATTVNVGNLRVTGTLGNTAVTVNTGATLSGSGTIGGTAHVTSGGHFSRSIATTPGAQVPLTVTGNVTIDSGNVIDLTAASAPASGVYVLATTTTGTISYTPGTVNLTGVSGSVSVSLDGKNLILTTGGSYTSWASANGIPGQLSADDSDKDGLTNLVEYALGTNPTTSSQPPGSFNPATRVLSFNKGADAISNGDVSWVIEESINLGVWTPMVTQNAGDASPSISYTLPAGQPKEFARLKVVKQP